MRGGTDAHECAYANARLADGRVDQTRNYTDRTDRTAPKRSKAKSPKGKQRHQGNPQTQTLTRAARKRWAESRKEKFSVSMVHWLMHENGEGSSGAGWPIALLIGSCSGRKQGLGEISALRAASKVSRNYHHITRSIHLVSAFIDTAPTSDGRADQIWPPVWVTFNTGLGGTVERRAQHSTAQHSTEQYRTAPRFAHKADRQALFAPLFMQQRSSQSHIAFH